MKTNILFISVIFLFATSCSDSFLDRTSLNNISEDTFWKTEEDALQDVMILFNLCIMKAHGE